MLNIIWPIMLIASFIYAMLFGNLPETNNAIFESIEKTITFALTLIGTMCLWSGMMKIAMETNLIKKIKKVLNPVLIKIFPEVNQKSEAYNKISMNIIANILGLGNAATPLGLEAMEILQKENHEKEKISNSMAMLIIINTASIQIIPTTVIAIRNSLNSKNPMYIVFPVWVVTICSAISAISAAKIIIKKNK